MYFFCTVIHSFNTFPPYWGIFKTISESELWFENWTEIFDGIFQWPALVAESITLHSLPLIFHNDSFPPLVNLYSSISPDIPHACLPTIIKWAWSIKTKGTDNCPSLHFLCGLVWLFKPWMLVRTYIYLSVIILFSVWSVFYCKKTHERTTPP